jgi:hypothetical protein
MFFETDGSKFVNMRHVASFEVNNLRTERHREMATVKFQMINGDTITDDVSERSLRHIATSPELVAAAPGFCRLEYYHCADGGSVLSSPVLAWQMDEFGNLAPVCVEHARYCDHVAVQYPDGRVIDSISEELHDDKDAWRKARFDECERMAKPVKAA